MTNIRSYFIFFLISRDISGKVNGNEHYTDGEKWHGTEASKWHDRKKSDTDPHIIMTKNTHSVLMAII